MIFKFFLVNVKGQLVVRHSAGPACSAFLFWAMEYLNAIIGCYFRSLPCEIQSTAPNPEQLHARRFRSVTNVRVEIHSDRALERLTRGAYDGATDGDGLRKCAPPLCVRWMELLGST